MKTTFEIDINGNPYNEFKQNSEKVRVTKLLTNNWSKTDDVFRISKIKDNQPKHSVDLTSENLQKIATAAKVLPDQVLEIGDAIVFSDEGPYIICDIYANTLLYTVGLGRKESIRIPYDLSDEINEFGTVITKKLVKKDEFKLGLHETLQERDWVIFEDGKFYLLAHYVDKVYKKVQINRDYQENTFYRQDLVYDSPEYICKPYQIENAIFLEDVTYEGTKPDANDFSKFIVEELKKQGKEVCQFKKYRLNRKPFHDKDDKLKFLVKYIQKFPSHLIPKQWDDKKFIKGTKEFDKEMYFSYIPEIPFRVYNGKECPKFFAPYFDRIIEIDGYEILALIDNKYPEDIFTCCNDKLKKFMKGSKEGKVKAGYLNMNNDAETLLILNRDKPIREHEDPLYYCLYKKIETKS